MMNMNNPTITLEMVRDEWRACYPAERLAMLYARPVPLRDAMTRTDGPWADVPEGHRVWVACYAMHQRALVLLAVTWAERAACSVKDIDPRVTACNVLIRRWLAEDASCEDLEREWRETGGWESARAAEARSRSRRWPSRAAAAAATWAARAAAWEADEILLRPVAASANAQGTAEAAEEAAEDAAAWEARTKVTQEMSARAEEDAAEARARMRTTWAAVALAEAEAAARAAEEERARQVSDILSLIDGTLPGCELLKTATP